MKLSSNIRMKSKLWDLVPWISNKTAQAVYPNIYLPKFVYENLQLDNPDVWHIALLIHENEHLKRQKRVGILKWGLKYIFIPRFRYEEEIATEIYLDLNILKKMVVTHILKDEQNICLDGTTSGQLLMQK